MGIVPDNAFLLVGIMPAVKDFEIARMLGWYRIPMRFAPKVVDVDYLAFYQGAIFGEDRHWQIEYCAEYRGHELTTRSELFQNEVDHPRAREEYYKVQLGPLIQLPQPILSDRWKRITFLYTTGELFNRARIVNDLVVRSEDRNVLWKTMKERSQQNSQYRASRSLDFNIDPSVIDMFFCLNKKSEGTELDEF